tara:strand:+ start:955 stop:1440 length:486 start_codon:yes stop_codon:yes gene_type:complete
MAIIKVNLTDTINGFRLKTNTLAETVGDLSAMSTSGGDSSVVAGVNSLDSDMGRQADLHYRESSDSTFLTLVDAINRIVDSDGDLKLAAGKLDSDAVLNHMIADDQIDSNHLVDSAIFGAKFEAMTVLKIFNSTGTELRKLYAPSIFDHDSAIAFATNPWV